MEEAKGGFVYLLTNDKGNILYIGSTSNLKERLYFHKKRMVPGFTKRYNVHKLLYFERHIDMASACKRERELKGKTRAKKEFLIKSVNPTFSEIDSKII